MLHIRLTPANATIGGPASVWLARIGTYGSWSDLQVTTRWGDSACGMYEARWTMPLPPDFEHPLLRRETTVELMAGSWRVGSPLIISEVARGTSLDQPWQITAMGIGREAEGSDSYYGLNASGDATMWPNDAATQAIARGLPWAGVDASVPILPTATVAGVPDAPVTLGTVLGDSADSLGQRWGVDRNNVVRFMSDPTTPSYQIVPDAAALGVGDDRYASTVILRYNSSTTGTFQTAPPVTNATAETTYGHREFPVDLTGPQYGTMTAAMASTYAAGILAKSKGRLNWLNGLTVTSNEILTMGGVPADLSKVLEDCGNGCMIRLHGIWSDLLAYNGQTWLDIIVGEAKLIDRADAIDLNPLGLTPRDLAAVIESVTGMASAA